MASKTPRWLLGCGVGCGAALLAALVLLGIGAVSVTRMMRDIDRAVATRIEVEGRFDAPENYTPAADGEVAPERLERFLQVRRALSPLCARFDDVTGRIEELDGREEPPAMGEILGVLGGALGFPRLMADYIGVRNQALLDAEMGLGEYTYLYVLAYASGPAADERDERRRERALSGRTREAILGMLERQSDSPSPERAGSEWLDSLQAEIRALRADDQRRPWAEGLPEPIASSLQPAREELEQLSCPLASEFALGRTQRQGITIRGD